MRGRTYYAFGCEWLRHFVTAAHSAGAPLNEVFYAMSIGVIEVSLSIYLVLGTIVLKAWNNGINHTDLRQRVTFIIGSIAMSVLPLIVLQTNDELRTAIGVVLSGLTVVWFAIICSREPKHTNPQGEKGRERESGV